MLMPGLYWPLESNVIRRNSVSNTFGMVRNGGKRPHQGWDLLAYPGTLCYAVADGVVASVSNSGDYGKTIVIRFEHRGRTLYAAYSHLSMFLVHGNQKLAGGEPIALSGNTGNAAVMDGDDQHLHFEIRTINLPGKGLGGRINPREIYGSTPLNSTVYDSRPPHPQNLGMSAPGVKVKGVNVL